jgi:Amidohydrolase family
LDLNPADPGLSQYAELLASSPVALMPTLSLNYLDLPDHRNPWQEPAAKLIDPKDIFMPANPLTGQRDEDQGSPAGNRFTQVAQALMRVEERYRRAGAKYLTGSGTTAFGTIPGVSLHTELELLSRVGLPPRQALAAATSNFGEIFDWKTVGQVKAGYNADLLVLNANPLQGIENLKNIHSVILNGEILDRDKLLAEPH